MKVYRAAGFFRQGKTNQDFTMDLVAPDEDGAREKICRTLEVATELRGVKLLSNL